MIPVRFVTENLGATIRWDGDSQIVMIYYGGAEESSTDLFKFDYKISILDARLQIIIDFKRNVSVIIQKSRPEMVRIQQMPVHSNRSRAGNRAQIHQ
jgi:Copper amine oxidase N-terminal domain